MAKKRFEPQTHKMYKNGEKTGKKLNVLGSLMHTCFTCMHAHSSTCVHTHTHTHARTHARTHTRAHTHHCCSEPVKSTHLGCTLAYPPPADPDTLAPAVSGSALSVWCRPSLFPIKTRVFSSNCLCGRVFVSVFVWE